MTITTKEIILSVLLSASALLAGFSWSKILGNPYWALAVLVYAVVFGFFLLLAKNVYYRWGAPFLSLVLFAAMFNWDKFLVYGFVTGAIFLTYAISSADEEDNASVKILLRRNIGRSLATFFTALAMFLSFIYYGSIYQDPSPERLLVPESTFTASFKLFGPTLEANLPGFVANDKTSGELYNFTLSEIKKYAGDYIHYVPFLAAVSYFFLLKAVSIFFYYAALILIFVLLKLFISLGLIKKELVDAKKEVLIYD